PTYPSHTPPHTPPYTLSLHDALPIYGIMGIGAICHTVNPRLFPEQIAWIVNHAEDRVVITDTTFVPLLEKLADKLPSVQRFIVRSEEHTSELQSRGHLVCRLLLEKKK